VLQPNPISASADVLSLSLFHGCGPDAAFGPAWAFPGSSDAGVVRLYAGTARQLEGELAARRRLPRSVYVCPSADPFAPLAEVQAEAARVVAVLTQYGVEVCLRTRGYLRPSAIDFLAAHADRVRVTVGLTTMERALQRVLEPLVAPPRLRLRQIAELRQLGIAVQVALEPLVPGLTDTRANLLAVLQALAAVGVGHVTTGYLILRTGLRDRLARALEPHGWEASVLDAFTGGPVLRGDGLPPGRYLPKRRRQRGYAALMALAAEFDITVSVSRLSNPDFQPAAHVAERRQRLLPLFEGPRAATATP
jgi:DNA repair photolyase